MENQYNINRINYSKYSNQTNDTYITHRKITSYGNSNTEINRITPSYKRYIPKPNNIISNKNNLLAMNHEQNTYNEKFNVNNDRSNFSKEHNNILDNNNRKNHTIFVRVESKNSNTNITSDNNIIKRNIVQNPSTYNRKLIPNNSNQNNNNLPIAKTNIINIEQYQKANSEKIPRLKSFQTNYIRNINSINDTNNKENMEKNKVEKNPTNQFISQKNNNRYKIQFQNQISNNEQKKDVDDTMEKEENLMDVVNKQIGIKNLGNTCFINSSLQIFIHCPLFIQKLISKEKLINENTPITSNFISICNLMLNTKVKYISIRDFKGLLGLKHKIFSGYMQHDSQEFSRIFLEDISRELNEMKANSIYRLLSNSDSKSKQMRDRDFHENFTRREKSIITDIFYAQIVNIYTCQCKAMIYSFQKILDFPLLFPEKVYNDEISLFELLRLYFSKEVVDFENKCDRCRKIEKHKKELKISRPPEILILSLQRVDLFTGKKLEYKVKFNQKLDLYNFIDHDCGYDKEYRYDLFGVINHIGKIDSGHYFSYIKNENKEWIEYNDSKVSLINDFSDCSETVYVLFYIKEKYNNSKLF